MRRSLSRFSSEGSNGRSSWSLFDRIIPPDPPSLKEYKDRERRVIREQFTRSKFVEAARAGGRDKLFLAGPDLSAALPDSFFPEVSLEPVRLSGGDESVASSDLFSSARATIVTLAFQGSSQTQLVPWHNALWEALSPGVGDYAAPPSAGARAHGGDSQRAPVQLLNIVYLQGWFWKFVKGAVAGGTRRALPPEVTDATYLCLQPSAREADHFADRLRVHNRVMGQVLLVDSKGFVRWRAHGLPGEGEVEALVHVTSVLANGSTGHRSRTLL